MIGTVEVTRWQLVAADADGVPQPEKIGRISERRYARFAYKHEAAAWLHNQQVEGFDGGIASCACSYYGPTDAPGNCWSVDVERTIAGGRS